MHDGMDDGRWLQLRTYNLLTTHELAYGLAYLQECPRVPTGGPGAYDQDSGGTSVRCMYYVPVTIPSLQ